LPTTRHRKAAEMGTAHSWHPKGY